jgi:alkylglycerol monooxygenase
MYPIVRSRFKCGNNLIFISLEQYGKILVIAMPIFLLLIVIEKIYGYTKGNDTAPLMDSVSSLNSGITNSVKDVLGISVSILSYEWMVSNLALLTIKNSVIIYIIAFFVIDFYGYWTHRWAHQINIFWNKHAIHHSSEEFNLSCALRQSISSFVNLFTFLLLPAAILGVPAMVISIVLPLHLFLQFWYHTRHIGKLGILEKVIVTPSHHRVHHAINKEYLDKNHGQIFIFWDKWFGTFQEELAAVPPVYGITRPAQTWNPIKINFQHLWLLCKDAWHAKNWKDKFRIWFMPTGWRPEGFEEKYPVDKIENVYNFEKYNPTHSYKIKELVHYSTVYYFGFCELYVCKYCYNTFTKFVFVWCFYFSDNLQHNRINGHQPECNVLGRFQNFIWNWHHHLLPRLVRTFGYF